MPTTIPLNILQLQLPGVGHDEIKQLLLSYEQARAAENARSASMAPWHSTDLAIAQEASSSRMEQLERLIQDIHGQQMEQEVPMFLHWQAQLMNSF